MPKFRFQQGLHLIVFLWLAAVIFLFSCALAADAAKTYTIAAPVLAAADDMEELLSDGSLHDNSTHLELGCKRPDSSGDPQAQLVFLRFANLPVPPGAQILQAYIQFTSYSADSSRSPFDFSIAIEDTADSKPLPDAAENASYAISARPVTGAVRWDSNANDPLLWYTENASGKNQQTPDVSALLQQTVSRPGWRYGNAASFILRGTGGRIAASYERNPARAAVLHITYTAPPLAQPAPETLSALGPANLDNMDGSIQGTTQAMEYRPANGEHWKPCGNGATAGLPAGEYLIRYAEKPGYLTGDSVTIHIPQHVTDVTLQPGSDETQMSFTWYSKYRANQQSLVQIAPKAAMQGDVFPAGSALTFTGENCFSSRCLSNSVTVTGLTPNTAYVYRLGNAVSYSKPCYFTTQNPQDFRFIFVGDPQIGASGGRIRDARAWRETLDAATATLPDAAFILSAGDQIEAEGKETQYTGFFSPPQLASIPLVPVIGNHDVWGTHARHFTPPNESDTHGTCVAGADYWFTYGQALFMVLNTNSFHIDDHQAFLTEALAATGDDIRWRIVVFHHSIYSSASHAAEPVILSWRKYLVPILDSLDIDVVLMGHDHCYTRTCQMLGGIPQTGGETTVTNPTGTLYITANSASGSKYYELRESTDAEYSAFHWQGNAKTYSGIAITGRSFSLVTYLADGNTVLDRYTICKE